MATPEEKLVAAVSPLCAGRLFPDFAPLGTPRPYAIWQQVGGTDVVFVDGDTADQLGVRFQIEVWADTRQQASMLMRQIAATLSAHRYWPNRKEVPRPEPTTPTCVDPCRISSSGVTPDPPPTYITRPGGFFYVKRTPTWLYPFRTA